jgi:hypothetical protein
LVLALLALDYRSALADHGVDRRSEEMIGTQLRSLVPKGERVFIATSDYGYFAVVAAFGRPSDTVIDQTPRPRSQEQKRRSFWTTGMRPMAQRRGSQEGWSLHRRCLPDGVPRTNAGRPLGDPGSTLPR